MVIMILGILDVVVSLFMFSAFFAYTVKSVLIIGAIYLLIKSVIFSIASINVGSIIDFIGAAVILLSFVINLPGFFFLIAGALVFQKGVFSLF